MDKGASVTILNDWLVVVSDVIASCSTKRQDVSSVRSGMWVKILRDVRQFMGDGRIRILAS